MPELPEVEVVKRQLSALIGSQGAATTLSKWHFFRQDLRFKLNKQTLCKVEGQSLLSVERRAKYLIFNFAGGKVLSHLGMTGSWRFSNNLQLELHDHVALQWSDGTFWIYNDPRRFGFIEPLDETVKGGRLSHLGPEPFDNQYTADWFWKMARNRKVAIKTHLMDQKNIVGVGNIYASEALFLAKIKPTLAAFKLSKARWEALMVTIRQVLAEAIRAGGSSIRDYRGVDGKAGGFQAEHLVYDREELPCVVCATPIRAKTIGGRSSFWCPVCQKS